MVGAAPPPGLHNAATTWLRSYAATRAPQSPHLRPRSVEYDHGLIALEGLEKQ
jgi:hypothetical protein